MQIQKIKLFGPLKELLSAIELEINPVENTDQLRERLESDYPQLKGFTYSIAINQEIITSQTNITTGDEVALLPPFAGG